jgi:hypothetical protein
MFGDHVYFRHGKVIAGSGRTRVACFLSDEGYVVGEMWLEINGAGCDLESFASVVFHYRVVRSRATQASFNVALVSFGAGRGSLRKSKRDQQGRYNHPQRCSLHGRPPKNLALRRSEISLGICFGFRFLRRTQEAFGLWLENLEHPGETTQP